MGKKLCHNQQSLKRQVEIKPPKTTAEQTNMFNRQIKTQNSCKTKGMGVKNYEAGLKPQSSEANLE